MGSPQSSETVSIMSRRLRASTPLPITKLSRPPCATNLRAGFKSSHAAWKPLESFGTELRFIGISALCISIFVSERFGESRQLVLRVGCAVRETLASTSPLALTSIFLTS